MTSSSAVRPRGMWNSVYVSLGCKDPPRLWAGPCDLALASAACAVVRDCPPIGVVAEVLRGRCDFALKATPAEAPLAHRRLLDTQQMLSQFQIVVYDAACGTVMEHLRRRHRRRKRSADLMIAAIVAVGQHILVARNQANFRDGLPRAQLANWIDDPPEASLP
jgi:predicted nucleic acid-binding protein